MNAAKRKDLIDMLERMGSSARAIEHGHSPNFQMKKRDTRERAHWLATDIDLIIGKLQN